MTAPVQFGEMMRRTWINCSKRFIRGFAAAALLWCTATKTVSAQSNANTAALSSASALIAGFGVSYTAPSGFSLSGKDGRIHALANDAQTVALVLYAGHFSSLELALGDAQRVLGVPREEDTQIIAPLAPKTFGAHSGLAGSLRVKGEKPVVAHVAVARINDSTMIGAVAVLEASAPESTLAVAVASVAQVLTAAESHVATPDAQLQAQLTGSWHVEPAATANAAAGSYTNEESWVFAADGTFTYRKRFSVNVPGASITPEERDENGRWYATGGAIVLASAEGRITVDVKFANGKMLFDGSTFAKR
jgi:hypothetical protein